MKKRILLLTTVAAFAFVVFSSENNGPALYGNNRTGAKATSTTCGTVGAGCHGGTSANTTVSITVDSGTTPVTHYVGGQTYTINIAGANTASLPQFGFQYVAVSGTGATQVQAGTNSYFPSNVAIHTYTGLHFVEHTSPLSGSNGSYAVSFMWTAPAAGTGNVTMYCTLNAVNGDNLADAADASNNTSVVLGEETAAPSSVADVLENVSIKAYPNPATDNLNLQLGNANAGAYTLAVYDLSGKKIIAETMNVTGSNYTKTINTHSWTPGMYQVLITKDGAQRLVTAVKQ